MQTSSTNGLVPSTGQRWQARKGKHVRSVVEVVRVTSNSVMIQAVGRLGRSMHFGRGKDDRVRTVPIDMFLGLHEPVQQSGGRDPHWLDQAWPIAITPEGIEVTPVATSEETPATTETMKHCKKCDTDYPLSNFYTDRSRKDGKTDWCRDCMKQTRKERLMRAQVAKKNEGTITPELVAIERESTRAIELLTFNVTYISMKPVKDTKQITAASISDALLEIATQPGTIEVLGVSKVEA